MILVDKQLRNLLCDGVIGISPTRDEFINPSSVDIRLGSKYTRLRSPKGRVIPTDPETFYNETIELSEYWLGPGEFVLVSMLEKLSLPPSISSKLMGKSSLARLGLDNSSAAGWLDPGWVGHITMELTNHSPYTITLKEGMKIGQLIFFKHEAAEKPYNISGRYYQQAEGQGSLGL